MAKEENIAMQQKLQRVSNSNGAPIFIGIKSQTSSAGTIQQDEKLVLSGKNLLANTNANTVLKMFATYESKGQLVCKKFNFFFPPSKDEHVVLSYLQELKKLDKNFNLPITDACISIPASIWSTALKDAAADRDVKTVRFSLSYGNGNFIQIDANIVRKKN